MTEVGAGMTEVGAGMTGKGDAGVGAGGGEILLFGPGAGSAASAGMAELGAR